MNTVDNNVPTKNILKKIIDDKSKLFFLLFLSIVFSVVLNIILPKKYVAEMSITQSSTLARDWLKIESNTSNSNICIVQNDGGTSTSC